MADDVTIKDAGGATQTVASDDDGSRQYQWVKLAYGPDNTFTKVQTANGLPIIFQPDATATGNITASGNTVTLANPGGMRGFHCQLIGTFSGGTTIQFEGSIDGGTTYFALPMWARNNTTGTMLTSTSGGGFQQAYTTGDFSGLTHARVRCSAFAGGDNVAVTLRGSVPGPATMNMGTLDTELPGAVVSADAAANPTAPFVNAAMAGIAGQVSGAANWQRWRSTYDGQALPSAARTTTSGGTSGDIINWNHRGVIVFLNITNIVTACSLQLNIQGKDVVSAGYYKVVADPTAVTATGLYVYEFYPGSATAAAGGVTARVQTALPAVWRVIVTHGNANSITYSVGFSLIL